MNISSGYNASVVAVVSDTAYERHEARLTVFDLRSNLPPRKFPVRYDFGGRRLSISRDSQQCFVGCYNVHGLAAYSALDGSELWRRSDLRGVQRVDAFPFDDTVFCGREGTGHLICAKTGQTLEKPREVKTVYSSPFSKFALVSARTLDVHSRFGSRIGKIARTTFTELHCCFSDKEVLVSESGGPVRCFAIPSLELLWAHVPPIGSHFLRLCFCQHLGCFIGIRWRYEDSKEPGRRVVHFERRTGALLNEIQMGETGVHEFCLAGSAILTQDLRLLCAETGQVLREFSAFLEDDGEQI